MSSKINFLCSKIRKHKFIKLNRFNRSSLLLKFKHTFFKYKNFIFVWHVLVKTSLFRFSCKKYGLYSVSVPNNFFLSLLNKNSYKSKKGLFENNFFNKGRVCILYSLTDNNENFYDFFKSKFILDLTLEEEFSYLFTLSNGYFSLEDYNSNCLFIKDFHISLIKLSSFFVYYFCWLIHSLLFQIFYLVNNIFFYVL